MSQDSPLTGFLLISPLNPPEEGGEVYVREGFEAVEDLG